ncbi:MAG TPA: 8-amino-7-oxononanoate synthase [Oligoflexus sp.]|uniref:aminotransferase class I/II-fold pyridoxal phosphate-dependent enzyme n=1 Tax=Oligoflexus sp. TaxID=1971216 RepID=UPI002D5FCB3E|nr:8-amino-7-oxononanoate synthase [Oligoflexus sp.]HYX39544.1 8-amino-7-oxononanoate synthase [Oligoflexus sp.]
MKTLAALIQNKLATLDALQRRRRLRPLGQGSGIDLTHNDYMGLREDRDFQARALAAAALWPAGSGASRLLGGEHAIYAEVEAAFAQWKGAASALYFPSGYAANEALMSALHLGDAVYFSDEWNHASLIDGMRLARLRPEQKHIFRHNDIGHLESLLQSCSAALKIIVVESLYSMDGDLCPARELAALAQRYEAVLIVDEAHALGVLGPQGQGWMAVQGIDPDLYISVNPCGKAMAGSGAFICGPVWLREHLINTARSFIFTTGASPWMAAALLESVQMMKEMQAAREAFQDRVDRMHQHIEALGFNKGTSATHIIPIILGREAMALAAEEFCKERGVLVRAIRPPTVPEGGCRLRLSLHAGLSDADEARIKDVLSELSRKALS